MGVINFTMTDIVDVLVKIWAGAWLFIAGGLWKLPGKELGPDGTIIQRAEEQVKSALWRINFHLEPKLRLQGSSRNASKIYQTLADYQELADIVKDCGKPMRRLARCRTSALLAKVSAGVLAVTFFLWGGLVLFMGLNVYAIGIPLFFAPLTLSLFFWTLAASYRIAIGHSE